MVLEPSIILHWGARRLELMANHIIYDLPYAKEVNENLKKCGVTMQVGLYCVGKGPYDNGYPKGLARMDFDCTESGVFLQTTSFDKMAYAVQALNEMFKPHRQDYIWQNVKVFDNNTEIFKDERLNDSAQFVNTLIDHFGGKATRRLGYATLDNGEISLVSYCTKKEQGALICWPGAKKYQKFIDVLLAFFEEESDALPYEHYMNGN